MIPLVFFEFRGGFDLFNIRGFRPDPAVWGWPRFGGARTGRFQVCAARGLCTGIARRWTRKPEGESSLRLRLGDDPARERGTRGMAGACGPCGASRGTSAGGCSARTGSSGTATVAVPQHAPAGTSACSGRESSPALRAPALRSCERCPILGTRSLHCGDHQLERHASRPPGNHRPTSYHLVGTAYLWSRWTGVVAVPQKALTAYTNTLLCTLLHSRRASDVSELALARGTM